MEGNFGVDPQDQVFQQSGVLPKVRSATNRSSSSVSKRSQQTMAVPATPRMLRNTSAASAQQQPQVQQQGSLSSHAMGQHEEVAQQQQGHLRSNSEVDSVKAQQQQQYTGAPNQQQQQTPSRSVSQRKKHTGTQQPVQFHRRSIGEWDFIKTVGAGSMGKVKLAKHRRTNEVCAIKIVTRASKLYERNHMNDLPPNSSQERLQRQKEYKKELERDRRTIRESSLGKILYHPFICRLFEVKVMSNHFYMLFEYVSGGQMLDYIVSHGSLKERHARKFARGIGSALDYLHKNNVVHRDLKIENIMISKSGDIKLIDFGLSNMYSNDSLLKTYCGSLYFAAPELLSAHPYIGPEIDVWSFGIVLYVLVCGKVPFDDQSVSVLHEMIKKGKVEYPSFLSSEVISLLSRMLVVNPNKRAHLSEVLSHPWMTKGFEGPPASFVPHRVPLTLPLDQDVVDEIVRLEFGQNGEQVMDDLTRIISSRYYQDSVLNWRSNSQHLDSQEGMNINPTMGFHPLISIYYLVDEMLQRKKTRDSVLDIPTANVQQSEEQKEYVTPQITQQATFSGDKAEGELSTPTPLPELTFPEAAHTTPTHTTSPMTLRDDHIEDEDVFVQQQVKKDESGKGLNSLLRKFSQRRAHSMKRPQGYQQSNSHSQSNSISMNDAPSYHTKQFLEPEYGNPRRVGSVKISKTSLKGEDDTKPKNPKTHTRAVSAYAGPSSLVDNEIPPLPKQSIVGTSTEKKYHPTARAKSVGHARREDYKFGGDEEEKTPLPTDINDDAFFDDITLDDFNGDTPNVRKTQTTQSNHVPDHELTEKEIMDQASKAPPGSMPSIEHPRSLFLKGFFSVQTTSTKPLPVIRADIISVLTKLGVQFTEVRGGFVCVHTPSIGGPMNLSPASDVTPAITITHSNEDDIVEEQDNGLMRQQSSGGASTEQRTITHDSGSAGESDQNSNSGSYKNHRRKFSIGGSILGYKRKQSIGGPAIPPTPVATIKYQNVASPTAHHGQGDFDSSASLNSSSGGNPDSMIFSSGIEQTPRSRTVSNAVKSELNDEPTTQRSTQHSSSVQGRTPLKFEIHLVKVPLVGLFGVHFKKVSGNTWMYKALAGQILNELNL
ncbi:KIN1/KIN2 family serine/threonine-protein kinase [Cyberlindnera jadinii NRRL Y-1542]|uniref:non-specific serine/threonine protein kinase n=1 Tax=Cyberlindnera jadinii (strain ATCC 18201 / CBS 1600 / BCRC 20928 / JCM 3617 / NBRC 0987 / NRRL Y-1542) TaxID=983966 RepID=A0A1E4S0L3_CYBJN|nr:Pkinase-domain-containing protein [Cyberlindnera jadinii NRRL Y-1542]ODV73040.1 Pkinase-domain-containing protein [Cyberlindnera jadinii NRRL Y-1542]